MNILVTGADGQLGSELRVATEGYTDNYIFTDAAQLDITDSPSVERFIIEQNVEVVVNCAAYTNVERAEQEQTLCDAINHRAVASLASIAQQHGVVLIHISTDFVFDGNTTRPYIESDTPSPLNYYGASKLAGEQAIVASGAGYMIIRTGWLYSSFGNNFIKSILRLASQRNELTVVNDQHGTPTYAADLAQFIVRVISQRLYLNNDGIYHYAGMGECTWYDFATVIVAHAKAECRVTACTSEQYPTKAVRPRYSVLDKSKTIERFGVEIPQWQTSLARCMALLK